MKYLIFPIVVAVVLSACGSSNSNNLSPEEEAAEAARFKSDSLYAVIFGRKLLKIYKVSKTDDTELGYFNPELMEQFDGKKTPIIKVCSEMFEAMDANNKLHDSNMGRMTLLRMKINLDVMNAEEERMNEFYGQVARAELSDDIGDAFVLKHGSSELERVGEFIDQKEGIVLMLTNWEIEFPHNYNDEVFIPGNISMDVTGMKYSTAEVLFKFPLTVSNSDEVEVTTYGNNSTSSSITSLELETDLLDNFQIRLKQELHAVFSEGGSMPKAYFFFDKKTGY